jgi:hypothetical protein
LNELVAAKVTCYPPAFVFGNSKVTVEIIKEYEDARFFPVGDGHPPSSEEVPAPEANEVVVFRDFFTCGFRFPCDPHLPSILEKFSVKISHPYTALTVAQHYFQTVYKLHGMPEAIISDRDRIVTSKLWKELFKLVEVKLLMSSTYHPQTDGQTKRLNQCLEGYLRCAAHSCPKQWHKWLALAEYWYNTSFHTALGLYPFEVLYGHPPRHFGISSHLENIVPDLEAWLQDRNLLTKLIQQQLSRAQQRMKAQADTNRSERTFAVGDKAYLKLQPHIQTFVASRSNQKLSFKFYGPYEILHRIGSVDYKLKFPDNAKIHLLVHVSQLK